MIFSPLADVAIGALCVWRVTHLLHAEDGPFAAVALVRRRIGDGFWGQAMGCFYCLSLWVALPVTVLLDVGPMQFLLLWPTLSGAACLLEQISARESISGFVYEETRE